MSVKLDQKIYQSYEYQLKKQFSDSKNPNLFPNLKIPRSTRYRWAKSSPKKPLTSKEISQWKYEADLERLKRQLTRYKEFVGALSEIKMHLEVLISWDRTIDKESLIKVAETVDNMKLAKTELMDLLSLSSDKIRGWKKSRDSCEYTKSYSCRFNNLNQLTDREVEIMRSLVTSKKFACFSIRSLCFYAKRQNLLHCAVSSWYKYIKKYGWVRPRKKKAKRKYGVGIRATKVNQIWHIDATSIKIANGRKYWIQLISDNLSRFVLSWKVSGSICGLNSSDNLKKAIFFAKKLEKNLKFRLIMDAGTENCNEEVASLINSLDGASTLLAKRQIRFSNSLSESLIRMLKNNWLYSRKLYSLSALRRSVGVYLNRFNYSIPHNAFQGATPYEVYLGKWGVKERWHLKRMMTLSQIRRKQELRASRCNSCSLLRHSSLS